MFFFFAMTLYYIYALVVVEGEFVYPHKGKYLFELSIWIGFAL